MLAARSLFIVALAAAASAAVACSAAPDSATKPLPVCDADDPECPGVPKSSGNKAHTEIPTNPVPAPEPKPAPSNEPDPPKDEADAGKKAFGPLCKELAACCDKLDAEGYTSFCRESLNTGVESVCSTKRREYKEPDPDTGEAVCP